MRRFADRGNDTVLETHGDFAIIVGDGNDMFVARDPVGARPLYWARRKDSLLFASEIKAFPPGTSPIEVFPAGNCFSSRSGFGRYYRRAPLKLEADRDDLSPEEAAGRLRQLLQEAVDRRLALAVDRVGVFLSGGIDSSVVTAALTADGKEIVSIAAGTSEGRDLEAARLVARHLGTEHHEINLSDEQVAEVVPEVIYHLESFDSHLVSSSIANYAVGREANRLGLKMVFCGEGSDELFAGYHYLKRYHGHDLLRQMDALMDGLPQNGLQRVDRMTQGNSLEGFIPFLDGSVIDLASQIPMEYKIHGDADIEKWILREAFRDELPEEVADRKKSKFFQGAGTGDALQRIAASKISDAALEDIQARRPELNLESKADAYCYSIFQKHFPDPTVINTVVRTITF